MVVQEVTASNMHWDVATVGDKTAVRGTMVLYGILDQQLAKVLKCKRAAFDDRLPKFEVSREKEDVSLSLHLAELEMIDPGQNAKMLGDAEVKKGELRLRLPSASLHKYECVRDDNGRIKLKVVAKIDSKYLGVVTDFLQSDAGNVFNMLIEPNQSDLGFDDSKNGKK